MASSNSSRNLVSQTFSDPFPSDSAQASSVITSTPTSHSHGPTPSAKPLKSSKLPKAKAGPFVGGALAVVAVIFALFLWRYFVLRNRKRKELEADGRKDEVNLVRDLESHPSQNQPPVPTTIQKNKSRNPSAGPSRDTQTKAALRQQYLANELRAIEKQQAALQKCREQRRSAPATESPESAPAIGMTIAGETTREDDLERQNEMLRQRIRELEEQQESEWARGLSDLPPPGYSE
ncbi:hypothetical protein DFH08DRAFT_877866 [Mycena albidolilacea]|uniref:Uncharacterized protein n=1 Tax=Mycena albidolilacea TaxID=1033008 RepID=A0AAD6ZRA0_9AGAR|nr:hypothetical protein DFH08DRAFT_877866 [Mycena albidolilacea]